MAIKKPLVVGIGHVGSLIALLLGELGMQVAGVDVEKSPSIPVNMHFTSADITDLPTLTRLCEGRDAVIACVPYHLRAFLNTTTGHLFAEPYPALRAL